jgi:glycosyltransferase involved in cell wall biosynthesis
MVRLRSLLSGILLERPTVRHAKQLISISPYVTAHYGNLIGGRVHEVPNAIARKYFETQRAPEEGRLLFAGRLIKRKGVLDLVRAVAASRRPEIRLIIAGAITDPDYERIVRSEAARLGIADRMEFCGLLSECRMLDEFGRAEALVLPSYQETAPMVVQQAMAAGLAVIATRICGVPYQVKHETTGFLFEPGAVEELAALLRRFGSEPSLASRVGGAAREIALERYHSARVADATVRVYESMIDTSGGRQRRD